jgi:glycosyltransferase involved in cell wall biosynthesis
MYLHHQILHSYDKINFFISPSKFHLNKIGEMGFKGPMVHLPNFVELDGYMPAYASEEDSIVYFGRLIEEKGLLSLLEAMKEIDGITLKILGDGPQREVLEARARNLGLENIQFLGYRTGDDLKNEIKKSKFFILPSLCYENNPRSIIEGFALGKPAVASAIGGIPELVKDQITGLTFRAGDVGDLAAKIKFLVKAPDQVEEMGKRARVYVEEELTADKYYQGLTEIYRQARLS